MDPNDYWKALRKSWIVIVALAIVGGIVGVGYASTLPDSYKAQSSLFVASNGANSGSDLVQGSTFTQNLVQSYSALATTSSVLTPVIAELNLDTTPTKLARQINAQTPLNTVFVNITVTDASAQRAADISNAVARSLRTVATDLAPTSSTGRAPIAISIVAPALVPASATGPNRHLIEITAALIGLVVGILYAIGRLLFDTRIRTVDDVEALSAVPVIGAVRRGHTDHVALRDEPDTALAEDFRRIGATLRFAGNGRSIRSITLTSSSRGVVGTEIALDVALAVAERSLRVLVIDADLRSPSLAVRAGLTGGAGLTDVLDGSVLLDDAVQPWSDGVSLLTAGAGHSNPHFALGSTDMADLVAAAVEQYDFVLVQAASVLDFADALTLGHLTDGTVVTARSRSTNRKQLLRGLDSLLGAKAPILGIVLTQARLDKTRGVTAIPATAKPAPPSAPLARRGPRTSRRRPTASASVERVTPRALGSAGASGPAVLLVRVAPRPAHHAGTARNRADALGAVAQTPRDDATGDPGDSACHAHGPLGRQRQAETHTPGRSTREEQRRETPAIAAGEGALRHPAPRQSLEGDDIGDLGFGAPENRSAPRHDLPREEGVLASERSEIAVERQAVTAYEREVEQEVVRRGHLDRRARRQATPHEEVTRRDPRVGCRGELRDHRTDHGLGTALALQSDEFTQPGRRGPLVVVDEHQEVGARRLVEGAIAAGGYAGRRLGDVDDRDVVDGVSDRLHRGSGGRLGIIVDDQHAGRDEVGDLPSLVDQRGQDHCQVVGAAEREDGDRQSGFGWRHSAHYRGRRDAAGETR
ncbi:hypothetical protein GCM10025867_41840 [Frondihabitans sucicola]|uniref:Polysaccharide chain length determinant N-terminal domain-containing protein n=1 Tax=Frondihabitans sucicola TaxID=1268041 RepID=A0ABM8GU05_9MICO|nr:hypothetical protein GCM10025867_41840 [Frondihabitans sucicola]